MQDLRTPHVIEREARELAIYNEFQELSNIPGAMKSQITRLLNEKYKIRSTATLHLIRKRVKARLENSNH